MSESTSESVSREARAYRLRADGLSLGEIAERLGYGSGQIAFKGARRFAIRSGLPWPLPSSASPSASPSEPSPGQRAYELRIHGRTWDDIAARVGLASAARAMARARDHAKSRSLPWPIRLPQVDLDGRARRAFELREQGLAWPEVARLAGFRNPNAASEAARRHTDRAHARERAPEVLSDAELHAAYVAGASLTALAQRVRADRRSVLFRILGFAQERGLPDPRLASQHGALTRPERQEQMRRAYELRAEGLSWAEVAERTGYAGVAEVVAAARAYAHDQRLAWPLRRAPTRSADGRGRRAYELRLGGMAWPEVSKELGLARADWAMELARRHAREAGLAWPAASKQARKGRSR